jgi:hypothetical protein
MRRLTFIAAGLAALLATSIAVAHGIDGAKSAKAVSSGFNATAAKTSSKTCTTTDGKTLTITNGMYTGTATGDPDLTGAITLSARSVVNSDGFGVVNGQLRIDVSGGRNTSANYSAVYDHGNIAGLAIGHSRSVGAQLLANLSAGFVATTGFTGGKLGGGTSGGSAVEVGPAKCARPQQSPPEKSEARGTITTLNSGSITVAGLTCAIAAGDSAAVNAKFKVNDVVEIHCSLQNGTNTLDRIDGKGHH